MYPYQLDAARRGLERELPRLKVNELKEMCLRLGLARSGRKAELIQRVQDHYLNPSSSLVVRQIIRSLLHTPAALDCIEPGARPGYLAAQQPRAAANFRAVDPGQSSQSSSSSSSTCAAGGSSFASSSAAASSSAQGPGGGLSPVTSAAGGSGAGGRASMPQRTHAGGHQLQAGTSAQERAHERTSQLLKGQLAAAEARQLAASAERRVGWRQ
ncbi:hypothetical protein EMIHUDRAFT_237689 [Emiliania huxleyi CCMP1516]|uniref:SAP domain-containing protein n=2 Tax=Emiliania huxleyi TaxID=2903 RepID=A0A0D3JPM8_EMIH1|nr:hypothetical protein EMIHUDRAFT_237689 [Emiliania huxleyi CCMP1516]EOD25463.1 hypothetical protein EMIHUDRAFT_237689 [Emiliania huxleyi CCMP1516]|eukprot:XP_005777892.1 hypothetical protein EMIHUDRAFT_237689 [Emiliania huxleyi CCMP1516]